MRTVFLTDITMFHGFLAFERLQTVDFLERTSDGLSTLFISLVPPLPSEGLLKAVTRTKKKNATTDDHTT